MRQSPPNEAFFGAMAFMTRRDSTECASGTRSGCFSHTTHDTRGSVVRFSLPQIVRTGARARPVQQALLRWRRKPLRQAPGLCYRPLRTPPRPRLSRRWEGARWQAPLPRYMLEKTSQSTDPIRPNPLSEKHGPAKNILCSGSCADVVGDARPRRRDDDECPSRGGCCREDDD